MSTFVLGRSAPTAPSRDLSVMPAARRALSKAARGTHWPAGTRCEQGKNDVGILLLCARNRYTLTSILGTATLDRSHPHPPTPTPTHRHPRPSLHSNSHPHPYPTPHSHSNSQTHPHPHPHSHPTPNTHTHSYTPTPTHLKHRTQLLHAPVLPLFHYRPVA